VFDARSGHVGFVVDKVELRQVFSKYFGFPCQFSFHLLLYTHHHLSSGAGKIGSSTWTKSHPNKINKQIITIPTREILSVKITTYFIPEINKNSTKFCVEEDTLISLKEIKFIVYG
jgi:hypothetical protein